MRSICFPNMFSGNSTNVWKSTDYKAQTKQNAVLLLECEVNELMSDPYFGIHLKRYLFNQNNYVLQDILADEIYTKLALFIPQLRIDRNSISFTVDKKVKGKVIIQFSGINQIDYEVDTYQLVLITNSNEAA